MIISRGRDYIYVHAPKTGGTSLALALEERAMKDDIMLGDTPKALKRRRRVKDVQTAGRLWKHSTLHDIDGLLSTQEIAGMFTFMLVRNPWSRMLSYYQWLRTQSFDHPAVILAKASTFGTFVRDETTQSSFRDWPYGRYMQDASGVERCDLFIRLEHFATDAAPLFDHLGFTLTLPHVNKSDPDADGSVHYPDDVKEIVRNVCSEDIERFGYEFPLPD